MRRMLNIFFSTFSVSILLFSLRASITQCEDLNTAIERAYLVEFQHPAIIDGGNPLRIKKEHRNFIQTLKKRKESPIKIRHTFSGSVFNGISISTSSDDTIVERLLKEKNVKAVWPVETYRGFSKKRHFHHGDFENMCFAHDLTGVSRVHEEGKWSGQGVNVGILCGGIDYTHPALGECFGQGCKVAYGYDFVGDFVNNIPVPDGDPMDDFLGTGTFYAGVIAATPPEGSFLGVAPNVTIGAYKIYGKEAVTTSDIVVKAIERAYEDGMDIITLMDQIDYGWPEDIVSVLANRLTNKGIIFISPQGNEGGSGSFASSAPGSAKNVISVTSFDTASFTGHILSFGETNIPCWNFEGLEVPNNTPFDLNFDPNNVFGCDAFSNDFFANNAALVYRGECEPVDIVLNAQAAGAEAVVLAHDTDDNDLAYGFLSVDVDIPVFFITKEDADSLQAELLANNPVTLVYTGQTEQVNVTTAGQVSSFSSLGLSNDLEIKPDIGAPGNSLYSTYPVNFGSYGSLSGTEVAAAYLAGVVALLKQKYPLAQYEDVITLLQNTALPVNDPNTKHFKSSVAQQGAGLVQAHHALYRDFIVIPSRISMALHRQNEYQIIIRNLGNDRRVFQLRHELAVAVQVNDLNNAAVFPYPAIASFDRMQIEVPGGSNASCFVQLEPNEVMDLHGNFIFSGFLTLTRLHHNGEPSREKATIPFAGFNGDWLSQPIFCKDPDNMPQVAISSSISDGAMHAFFGDTLQVEFTLAVPSQMVRVSLVSMYKDKFLGLLSQFPMVTRNQKMEYVWDGYLPDGTLARTGHYRIQISALRIYSDPNHFSSYEHWYSDTFSFEKF